LDTPSYLPICINHEKGETVDLYITA